MRFLISWEIKVLNIHLAVAFIIWKIIGKCLSLPSVVHLQNGTTVHPSFSESSKFYWEKENHHSHLKTCCV